MVQRVRDWVSNRKREKPAVPLCPDHHTPMQMRGLMGSPTRFTFQTEENYTVIYFCPIPGCAETAEVVVARTQIPVPGASPRRPDFARQD